MACGVVTRQGQMETEVTVLEPTAMGKKEKRKRRMKVDLVVGTDGQLEILPVGVRTLADIKRVVALESLVGVEKGLRRQRRRVRN